LGQEQTATHKTVAIVGSAQVPWRNEEFRQKAITARVVDSVLFPLQVPVVGIPGRAIIMSTKGDTKSLSNSFHLIREPV
jgi:hypothetical protein